MRKAAPLVFCCSLAGATGCSQSMFDPTTPDYDPQECVEDAIGRSPDPADARRAAREFDRACHEGDAAACSALGVLTESGHGTTRDVGAAEALFAKACAGHNPRGCAHLSRIELERGADPRTAGSRLEKSCEDGATIGCEELGRRLVRGDKLDKDVRRGRTYLERACVSGRGAACHELGTLDTPPGTPPNAWTLDLFVKACVAGHQPACERLDVPDPSVTEDTAASLAGLTSPASDEPAR